MQPLHRSILETAPTDSAGTPLDKPQRVPPGLERHFGARANGTPSAGREPATLTHHRRAPQNLRHRVTTGVMHFGALVAADLVALGLVLGLYLGLRDGEWLGTRVSDVVRLLVPAGYIRLEEYAVAFLIGLLLAGNYHYGDHRREPGRLLAGCALAMGLVFWDILWAREAPAFLVVLEYGLATMVVWGALVGERVAVDVLLQRFAPRNLVAPRTLLVGSASDCEDLHESRVFGWERDYTYVGFVHAGHVGVTGALGTLADLSAVIDRHKVHWVVVASSIPEDDFRAVMDAAASAGCKLFAGPAWLVRGQFEPQIVWRRGHGLLELTPRAALPLADTLEHAPDGFYVRFGKRVFDIFGALLGLVLGAIPALVAAVAMRLETRGPLFILQPRVGRGGRIFDMVKLRSMVADAERDGQAKWADVEDPRITPVGRWVRRLRLDELPQFVNVLMGQMSLVGPRPERPEMHDQIVKVHPEFAIRVAVKPGLTGLAQIFNGYADSVDSSQRKLAYDRRYIANISLGFDFTLLLRTVKVVLTGHGSR